MTDNDCIGLNGSAGRIDESFNQSPRRFINRNQGPNSREDSAACCDSRKLLFETVGTLRPARNRGRVRPKPMQVKSVGDCRLYRRIGAVDWVHSTRLLRGLLQAVGAKSGGLLCLGLVRSSSAGRPFGASGDPADEVASAVTNRA